MSAPPTTEHTITDTDFNEHSLRYRYQASSAHGELMDYPGNTRSWSITNIDDQDIVRAETAAREDPGSGS